MQTQVPQAGWYPDPMGRAGYRWWSGEGWTRNISQDGRATAEESASLPIPIRPPNFVAQNDVTSSAQAQAYRPARWDAHVSSTTEIRVSAGTAFKIGFFGFWGAVVASIVPWLVILIVLAILGAGLRSAVP